MNQPSDYHSGQPSSGMPPFPPNQHLGYPPPPYPPRKSNTGLIIGIVLGGVVVVGAIVATLFLTGVIGGGGATRSSSASDRVSLTRENVVGSWSSEGDCSIHITQFLTNGDYWQAALDNPEGRTPRRQGKWRLRGNLIEITLGDAPTFNPFMAYNVIWIAREEMETTTESMAEPKRWVRCPDPLTADNTAPPVAGQTPAPSGGSGDLQNRLQQAVAQVQPRLPMQNGPVTITSIAAVGSTLRMEGTIAADLGEADWAMLDTAMRRNVCSGNFAEAVRRGATAETVLRDFGGETRTVTVSTC
jgi:hypothetical protein